jgi:integrase
MAKKPKSPQFVACKIVITSHPKAPWRVSFPVEENGVTRRKRRMFSTEEKALAFAIGREKEVADHGVRFGSVTAEARRAYDSYRDARHDLRADGIEPPTFEALVADAVARLRKDHADRQRSRMTIAEAVEAFLAYKKPRVGERHLCGLKGHLVRFAKAFGTDHVDAVTSETIEAWILGIPGLSAVTRNKHRTSVKAFYAFAAAKAQKWCEHSPLGDLAKERVATKEPKAYPPTDVAKIMEAALAINSPILPALALGMFAGLRPSEARALDLSVINFDSDGFRTPAFHPTGEPTKTGARVAPLTAAGKAWLGSQTRRTGLAWDDTPEEYQIEMRAVLEAAGVKGIYDGARHSFISYRTAEIRDVARVADECGNSPNVIKRHYREIVTGEGAKVFFSIRPVKKGKSKITNIETGRISA